MHLLCVFPITINIYFTADVLKYTGKIMYIYIYNYMYTYSTFRVLNFMLPAYRPNSDEASRDT